MLYKVFNKSEEDFSSDDYEDYVERYEDMIVELMEFKNDIEVSKYIEALKTDPQIHNIPEINSKRRKPSPQQDSPQHQQVKVVIDPYKDIEKPSVVLKRVPALPKYYHLNVMKRVIISGLQHIKLFTLYLMTISKDFFLIS